MPEIAKKFQKLPKNDANFYLMLLSNLAWLLTINIVIVLQ